MPDDIIRVQLSSNETRIIADEIEWGFDSNTGPVIANRTLLIHTKDVPELIVRLTRRTIGG